MFLFYNSILYIYLHSLCTYILGLNFYVIIEFIMIYIVYLSYVHFKNVHKLNFTI